jgi:hypothetical protein
MKQILTIIAVASLLVSCGGNTKPNFVQNLQPGVHQVQLVEALQTNNYTYLLVKEKGQEMWLAVPKMEAEIGSTYYYKGGMEMSDFQSKELDRVFESIWFLGGVFTTPDLGVKQDVPATTHSAMVKKDAKMEITVETVEGGISIGDLFANMEKYDGKVIKVSGQVTKFNAEIMGKNWIHIQDGTDHNGLFDLTITTTLEFEIGATVNLEGKIALNKDFGYGYKYDIILEEAVLVE